MFVCILNFRFLHFLIRYGEAKDSEVFTVFTRQLQRTHEGM
jgi:hypothetical protein